MSVNSLARSAYEGHQQSPAFARVRSRIGDAAEFENVLKHVLDPDLLHSTQARILPSADDSLAVLEMAAARNMLAQALQD